MSFNDLPATLTTQIVSYLALLETRENLIFRPKISISRYASISLRIQHAIEQRSFSRLTITSDDLATFEKLVARSRSRRAILRDVTFQAILPAYDMNVCTRFERSTDRKRNDEAFSTALKNLFTVLLPFNEDDRQGPFRLAIDAPFAPGDRCHRDDTFVNEYGDFDNDLSNARFAHSYLRLDHPSEMPCLNKVTEFDVCNSGPRCIAPGPIFSLLQSLPRVNELFLQLNDNEKLQAALRKQLRIDFTQALTSRQSANLTKFNIEYLHESPGDHRSKNIDVRNMTGSLADDPLSLGLSQFISSCEGLTEVRLGGPICVDETLFTLIPDDRWAHIKKFIVDLSCVRPDGGWYLDEHTRFPRDEPSRQDGRTSGSDDETWGTVAIPTSYTEKSIASEGGDDLPPDSYDKHAQGLQTGDAHILWFRSQPTEKLEQIWIAAARASALMPRLEMMTVGIEVAGCPRTDEQEQEFSFLYYAKGSERLDSDEPAPLPELRWTAPSEWEMSKELEAQWRKVMGPTGVITHEHWWVRSIVMLHKWQCIL